ncbi:MAG: alpha-L-arabinofuranosidase [Ktedonobacteraceae bacterium]
MLASNNTSQSSPASERQAGVVQGWHELNAQERLLAQKRRRRLISILSVLLLILTIFATVRLVAVVSTINDQLLIHIGNQQVVTLDLRQSLPLSPNILGTNVFPQTGTSSNDAANGFMNYSPALTADLKDAHVKLLRFPGGNWGEDHYLSLSQLTAFSTLLQQVNANGMIQARLSGPIKDEYAELKDLKSRAAIAGRWVDFMNNPHSDQRTAANAHAPFHPVKYWTVGNEPDKLINPATGKKYLVSDYVNDFIEFSTEMHKNDPTIKVFGPEISNYYGPGAGPRDANGQLWMEGFLEGVGAYEQAHNVVLLDGVSFHRYQFTAATQAPYMLLSSTGEWNYLLPALHQLISQNLKQDVPLAITEINTNLASQQTPAQGLAALWWGDTLATLMNQQVSYIAFASASEMDTPYPLFATDNQQPTSMFRVMQLFSHLQPNLVPLEVQRDPVSVYATQDNTHQNVSLLFINKASTSQLVQINGNSNLFGISPWSSLNVSLTAYSMVVVTLHMNRSAEAYSFIAPASDNASTPPVVHTVCGNKTDALANAIPC